MHSTQPTTAKTENNSLQVDIVTDNNSQPVDIVTDNNSQPVDTDTYNSHPLDDVTDNNSHPIDTDNNSHQVDIDTNITIDTDKNESILDTPNPLNNSIKPLEIIKDPPDNVKDWWAIYLPKSTERANPLCTIVTASLLPILLLYLVWVNGGAAPKIENRYWGPSSDTMIYAGAITNNSVASGQYWRLLQSLNLVPSLLQCLLSMPALVFCGFQLEEELTWMFPIIYILSGGFGNLFAATTIKHEYIAGPLPALAGMKGAIFSEIIFSDRVYKVKASFMLLVGTVCNCLYGAMGHADWVAECLSFWVGFWLAAAYRCNNCFLTIFVVILLLFAFGFTMDAVSKMHIIPAEP